jgi:arginine deiminase
MNSSQRAEETRLLTFCYEQLGHSPILAITGDGRLEGGDYIPAGKQAFIGCGMRTNIEGIRQIMDADAFGHDTIVVVKDRKWWQMQMHLDTYFNIIDKDLCSLVESRLNAKPIDKEWLTVDVYARAENETQYTMVRHDYPFVDYLHECGYQIIPINKEDELHYANNYLTIAPRHILAVANQSEDLAKEFARHGVKVEWVPLENLIKGYGAAHCMTQVMKRKVYHPGNTHK